ncbi:MAG: glycoside hydrolase family 28 protein [Bacteroidota bacterium]|nr:glycoside hydrolase family 28 protein [Bacteroidota bacterium]MDP4218690.1 glycoside hydrolase family 28 protein [Bacteroidota bacterium]
MNLRPAIVRPILLLCLFAPCIAPGAFAQADDRTGSGGRSMSWYREHAPFPMPVLTPPSFPASIFSIADFGAIGDGQFLNTDAFGKAIAACVAGGGGRVLVPPGLWLTGPIQLQSHVELHLERGALVIFTKDRTQYPIIPAAEGHGFVVASPVYGFNLTDMAITGEGVMDGGGESWRPVKKSKMTPAQWKGFVNSGGVVSSDGEVWWPSMEAMDGEAYLKNLRKKNNGAPPTAGDLVQARDYLRPYMVYLVNCRNVLLQNVTLRNSPKYVVYPHGCRNLIMDHVNIFNEWWAQNGDGVDISACKDVILYRCNVSAGDDGICMKSSDGGKPGDKNDAALENILIAGCVVYHAHGGFVIGSNTDGGMHNIFVSDCSFAGTDVGLRFKSNMGRGGLVDNIFIQDISMRDIATYAIVFDTYYENMPAGYVPDPNAPRPTDKTPEFRNFHISRIHCNGAQTAISITGLPQMPVRDIHFDSVEITAEKGLVATQARGIDLHAVRLTTVAKPVMQVDATAEVRVR